MSMAVVMAEMPDVWRKVLAEHVPDERQYCRACFHDGGRASWPCQTYRIAQEAKWVAEGGLPGTGPHGPGPSRTRLSPPEEHDRYHGEQPSTASSYASSGDWASPSGDGWSVPSMPSGSATTGLDRPLTGDPLAGDPSGSRSASATTGERPYGASSSTAGERPYRSAFDAPYGASSSMTGERPYGSAFDTPYGAGPGTTGERPYGSTFDAPYGSSFGVDDRPHASRW